VVGLSPGGWEITAEAASRLSREYGHQLGERIEGEEWVCVQAVPDRHRTVVERILDDGLVEPHEIDRRHPSHLGRWMHGPGTDV
jgi:hypothetical protein